MPVVGSMNGGRVLLIVKVVLFSVALVWLILCYLVSVWGLIFRMDRCSRFFAVLFLFGPVVAGVPGNENGGNCIYFLHT